MTPRRPECGLHGSAAGGVERRAPRRPAAGCPGRQAERVGAELVEDHAAECQSKLQARRGRDGMRLGVASLDELHVVRRTQLIVHQRV